MSRLVSHFTALTALLSLALLVPACGGSGGGEGGTLGSIAQRGSVAVMLASESSDSGLGLYVTYTKIALVPEDGSEPVVIYEDTDGKEVNVSELDDEALLFAVSDDVPTGAYTKLLVTVDSVRVVGGPCEDLETSVPDDELELVPEDPIDLAAGDTVVLRLEMDSDQSVLITVDGETDTCTVRPVVDVEITTVAALNECPTGVEGTVAQLQVNQNFEPVGMVLDLGGTQGEQDVLFDEETAFFDTRGYPAESDILAIDDEVGAKGQLDEDGALVARVVVEGDTAVVTGTIQHDAERGTFSFLPDDGQSIVGRTVVRYFEGTQILLDCAEATDAVIRKGAAATVTGKVATDDATMRAVSILVSPDELCGEITRIETTTGGWQITMIPDGTETYRIIGVPSDVGFYLQGDGEIPSDMLIDLVACGRIHGCVMLDDEEKDDVAAEVRIAARDFRGAVERNAAAQSLVLVDGTIVSVTRGATLLDLRDGQKLIELEDIAVGDVVRVFGLDACPDEQADFYAFVVLVLPAEDKPDKPDRPYEGCGLGVWKNHKGAWPDAYSPNDLFDDVFEDTFPGMTLLDVLRQGGGGTRALGRHTVAALLNAASKKVNYRWNDDEVIELYNDTVPNGDVERTKDRFEYWNERGCPWDDDGDDDRDDDERDERDED